MNRRSTECLHCGTVLTEDHRCPACGHREIVEPRTAPPRPLADLRNLPPTVVVIVPDPEIDVLVAGTAGQSPRVNTPETNTDAPSPRPRFVGLPPRRTSWLGLTGIAAAIVTVLSIPLNVRDRSAVTAARSAVAKVVTPDAPSDAIHGELDELASAFGSDTLEDAVRREGDSALRTGTINQDPTTAADAFSRAAACYEYLARKSPLLLEIAADALDRAGDLHCELGQSDESRECHRRSHAHFTTLLTLTDATSEASARFADKQLLAAKYMSNATCP